MPAAKGQVLVAVESFVAEVDGAPFMVQAGVTRVRKDHPVVAGREHLFQPDSPTVEEH
jgi:hypothetical protein